MMMIEVESVEARDRYMPDDDGFPSEEAKKINAANKEAGEKLWEGIQDFTTCQIGINTVYTDYVVICESP